MEQILKALIQNSACTLAAGVVSNLPDNLSQQWSPDTEAQNLLGFQIAQVIHNGLVDALEDEQHWKTPSSSVANSILQSIDSTVLQSVPFKNLVSALLGLATNAVSGAASGSNSTPPSGPGLSQ